MARDAAEKLLRHYAVEKPEHIMLEAFAEDQGATVYEGRLDGAVARLVRVGNRGRIRVSDRETNEGRKRFCVAHELGHFLLGHADDSWVRCVEGDLHDFDGRSKAETEANYFASEFLLPASLFRKRCDIGKVDLRPVRSLAEEFRTSITSTAIRFVEFCPEMCAVIFSQANTVLWSASSESLWCWVRTRGKTLDPESGAGRYFALRDVADRPQKMDSACWLEDKGTAAYEEVVEHSMPIPSIDAVLTMLWVPPSR